MLKKFITKFLPTREVKHFVPVQSQSFHGWLSSMGRGDLAKSIATLYYLKCYPVNAGIGEISDRLRNIKPVYLNQNGEEVENDVTKFLAKPNQKETLQDILNKININFKSTGEVYIVKSGITKVIDLCVLPSVKVQVDRVGNSGPQSFVYSDGSSMVTFSLKEDGKFWNNSRTEELIYLHEYNPLNNSNGLSPLSSISLEIEQYMSAGGHNLSTLTRQIKPSLILSAKSEFMPSPEQVEQFKKYLDEFYTGSENAGNYLITGNFDVNKFSTRSDMDYKELTNSTRNSIFQKLGVPITIADTTASTYNNRQLDQLTFYDDTVIPLFKMYMMFLINSIQDDFKGDRIMDVTINETDIPALAERALANLERRSKIGHMSINELRDIDGYGEVDGGDFIYRPSSDVPVSSGKITEDDMTEAMKWQR